MKTIKRALGLVWMALGPLAIVFLYLQAADKIALAHTAIERSNTSLQWGIILFIFVPISAGLVIFGWYGVKGEYDEE